MERNLPYVSRSPLQRAAHTNTYDPSAQYRALLMPPAIRETEIQQNNQYPSNFEAEQEVPPTINNQASNSLPLIPKYYYPNYNEPKDTTSNNPVSETVHHGNPDLIQQPVNPDLTQQPVVAEYPYSNTMDPYYQPVLASSDPYYTGQYYPYTTPYYPPVAAPVPTTNYFPVIPQQPIPTSNYIPVIPQQPIPTSNHIPHVGAAPQMYELTQPNVVNTEKKDVDLSRLEVYHFVPKPNPLVTVPAQPMPQLYSLPAPSPPRLQPLPQYPVYPYSGYTYQPYTNPYDYPPYNSPCNFPYLAEPPRIYLPPIEKKARSMQTENPTTSRGVSPMNAHHTAFDRSNYPSVHQRVMLTDEYQQKPLLEQQPGSHYRNSLYATPLPDCRCIHCQRERAKVLNYYSD
ncbi:unnamed protein product [Adineta steineri]|uniref:Uncharacterized protein n=1 Tax=Adineta steineri TaxID=433720 RepID=A0A813SXN2_9BILA|nr:unnamed protein product [Adineta steineri]CAF1239165.1 unnamed protein product [Adineta steineri]